MLAIITLISRVSARSCPANVFGVYPAFRVHRQVGDLDPAFAQAVPGVQDSVVLDGGGDEVIAGLQRAKDGEIVTFRAPACEDHLGRAAAEQGGYLRAGVLHRVTGMLPLLVDRGRVAEPLQQKWAHGIQHLGKKGCGGVGVHVDSLHLIILKELPNGVPGSI